MEREKLTGMEGVLWTEPRIGGDVATVPLERLPTIVSGSFADDMVLELAREGSRLEVSLRNPADPTAWARWDHNYVQIDLEGAVFGPVQLGNFSRMELARRDRTADDSSMERLRRADRLRLYFLMLDSGQEARSGTIRVTPSSGGWNASVSATVLGPTGEVRDLVPDDGESDSEESLE
jgi:hypothetical protein